MKKKKDKDKNKKQKNRKIDRSDDKETLGDTRRAYLLPSSVFYQFFYSEAVSNFTSQFIEFFEGEGGVGRGEIDNRSFISKTSLSGIVQGPRVRMIE